MKVPSLDKKQLEEVLEESLERHDVPGAVVGVRLGTDEVLAARGVVNLNTGVPVTEDTLFLIGSISKVYTATLVMALHEQGKLDIDGTLRQHLPEIETGDPEVAEIATVRQLISHSSGIDEDLSLVVGRGDDCLAQFVAAARRLPQVHPPGALFSYCNSGFMLSGRIIELVTGKTYDEALHQLLLGPLGLTRTVTLPEEAILHRTAVGHLTDAKGHQVVTPIWTLPRAAGPAGGLCTCASDLLEFASFHVTGGKSLGGKAPVSSETLSAMREAQVEIPDRTLGSSQALGWRLWTVDDDEVIGHWGGNIGQYCRVVALPSQELSIVILANAFRSAGVHDDILTALLGRAPGRDATPPPPSAGGVQGPSRYLGTYKTSHDTMIVTQKDGSLWVTAIPSTGWVDELYGGEKATGELRPIGASAFETPMESIYGERGIRVLFLGSDASGNAEYIHSSDYAYPRVRD